MSDEEGGQVIHSPITPKDIPEASGSLWFSPFPQTVRQRLVVMPGDGLGDIMILYNQDGTEAMRLPFPSYNQDNFSFPAPKAGSQCAPGLFLVEKITIKKQLVRYDKLFSLLTKSANYFTAILVISTSV